jgi:hypothetical protein
VVLTKSIDPWLPRLSRLPPLLSEVTAAAIWAGLVQCSALASACTRLTAALATPKLVMATALPCAPICNFSLSVPFGVSMIISVPPLTDTVSCRPCIVSVDIRQEFAIDEEALPLVLGLLDQVYELRRHLRRMCDALAAQPPEVQAAVRRALPPRTGPEVAHD